MLLCEMSVKSLIRLLYPAVVGLLSDLPRKFIKKQVVFDGNGMNVMLKPVSELQSIALSNKEVFKTLKEIDINSQT